MKGLDLSFEFYTRYGLPMLTEQFFDCIEDIAVGLVGHGSECYGYDDVISTDHDFEPSFCIWLTEEDEKKFGFKLMRAYSKLPKEFNGIKCNSKSLLGSNYRGVMTIDEFYKSYTGRSGAPETWQDWLYTPSHYFAEATNGRIFADPKGEFTRIREKILLGMPNDVKLKKIASYAFGMAQSGQYNYSRCVKHSEYGAARLALNQFATDCANLVFVLEGKYAPYYKWLFRSMKELPRYAFLSYKLEHLLSMPTDSVGQIADKIEEISYDVIKALKEQDLSSVNGDYLEPHAFSANERIKDGQIRNLPIML